MTAVSAALRGRILAEALMTSECTIRARGEGTVTDPETWAVVPAEGVELYSGRCRIRPGGGGAADVGGGEAFLYDLAVSVPFEAAVPAGSILTVTASPDPSLVGVKAEVARVDRGESITARRLYCTEAT